MNGRKIAPVWILALPWLTFGMVSGFVLVTLPNVLGAQGIPGARLGVAVAVIGSPMFWNFIFAPLLDVRFNRRTYALVFGILGVAATAFTVLHMHQLVVVEIVMLIGFLSVCMYQSAVGGWVGSLIGENQDSKLGAWSTVYNLSGGGIGTMVSGYAIEHWNITTAATLCFAVFLAPLLAFIWIPSVPVGTVRLGENFSRFVREIGALIRRPQVLMALAMFILPSASFALTNVLSGWSGDFRASELFVSLIGGGGIIAGGIIGSLLVPILARRIPLRALYLSIGLVGASFTLCMLMLPRTEAVFGLVFLGENTMQSAAIAAAAAITFEVIGTGNPLAATTYALLIAAGNLPIDYMAAVDARGYAWHGISGALLTDALLSAGACLLLVLLFRRRLLAQPQRGAAQVGDLSRGTSSTCSSV